MTRTLKPCGTVTAYQRHLKWGETPCDDCRAARREFDQKRYRNGITRYTPMTHIAIPKRLLAALWETATPDTINALDDELGADTVDRILQEAS